jgi:peptidoglycan/xylan/chitin deacetylase (PgdA/CDA1 family)
MTAQKLLKRGALSILRGVGAYPVLSSLNRRDCKLLILCYHGISLHDEHEWLGGLYLSPDRFRERLHFLKVSQANVLNLDEGLERLRSRSLPPRSVVITFDDGFHDFYRRALPILREFNYPSTVYVSTYYSKYRLPIFNLILDYILWKSKRPQADLSVIELGKSLPIRNEAERAQVVQWIVRWADTANLSTQEKNDFAAEFAANVQIDYELLVRDRLLQIMSPDEISVAASAGVQIELHTHRHRTPRDCGLFQREIRDNRACIREFTGRDPMHFCYPSGDYALEFLPWLREMHVKSATTCELGLAKRKSDPLLLPRVLDAMNIGDIDFESWLLGIRS